MLQEFDFGEVHPEVSRLLRVYSVVDTVGFDSDGVLFDLDRSVVQKFNSVHGTSYTVDDITEWNSIRNWLLKLGKPFEIADASQFKDYWENRDLIKSSLLIRGAREITLASMRDGKKVIVATSRKFHLDEVTRLQVRRWLGWVPQENIRIRDANDDDQNGFKARVVGLDTIGMFFENDPLHIKEILMHTDAHVVLVPDLPRYEIEYPEVVSNSRVLRLPKLDLLAQVLFPNPRILY